MINVSFAVVGTLLCMTLCESALADSSTVTPGSWGVNVQTLYRAPALKKVGAQWVRLSIRWDQIERAGSGRYDWSDTDKALNYYLDNGFHVVGALVMEKSNPVYAATRDADAISSAVARWMGAVAQRYKGKGIVWEIGNEPETFPMGNMWNHPNIYTAMAKAAATAIKRADPSAKVAALALAWMDRDFASAAFKAGLLSQGNIDYLSFHGYHRHTIEAESGLAEDIGWLRSQAALAAGAGQRVPEVIDSECGYSIVPFESPKSKDSWRISVYTEEAQAAYLARHFIEEIYLGVPISIWYKDMRGETQFSLYYSDDSDPKGLRPMGRVYQKLSELLPDSPASLKNDRFTVSVRPSAASVEAAKTVQALHVRSFLREEASTGRTSLIIAAWNAVEAFEGKILASRTFNGNQVLETWRDIKASDPVSVPSRISIDGLATSGIQSASLLNFQRGNAAQQNVHAQSAKDANAVTLDLPLTPMPTIVTIALVGGPAPPTQLRVSPED